MASDEKRSALDELIELDENGRRHIFSHSTLATDAREELRALRAEVEHWKRAYNGAMASLADQALKLGQEAHKARVEAEDLREALERARAVEKYACHRATCIYFDAHLVTEERPCSCGLSALLRREDEQ